MKHIVIASILALAACGDGTNPFDPETVSVQASFATPDATGTFGSTLSNAVGGQIADASGDGYSYELGSINSTNTLVARAGLLPGSSVASGTLPGSATMAGVYNVRTIVNAQVEDGAVSGDTLFAANLISLTADFTENTLTGAAAGLEIDGAISTGLLSGDVTYNGISGSLTGIIGPDQAIGAFQGSGTNAAMAGGFNVTVP